MDALDPKDLQPQTMLGMKLIQQPFSKQPDAESLFDFDSLKQTRDTVLHHLQFSHMLMVIQAKKGGGKNSFANSLIVSDHPALYFFNATAEKNDSLTEIFAKAAVNNHANDVRVLEKRMHDIMYRGQQPVMIVNDAHLLSDTDLTDLIEHSQVIKDDNQQSHLKLLLLGDHSLEKNLETNGIVNHNQFYIIDLPQLNVSNTRGFIMHRLTNAGFRDASPFSDKDITNIFNMANGNPTATLEYAAENLNKNKSLYEENFPGAKKGKTGFVIAGVVLFIAAFIYNSLLSPELESEPGKTEENLALPSADMKNPPKSAVDNLFKSPGKNGINTMDVKQGSNTAPAGQKLAPDLNLPAMQPQTRLQSADVTAPVIKPAETSGTTQTPQTASGIPLPTDSIQTEQPPEENLASPVTETQKPLAPPEQIESKPAPTKSTQPAAVAKKTEPVKTSQPADRITRSFKIAGVNTPDWLLLQDSSHWSLQILGAYKPETLLAFVHQHRLGNKVAYYRTRLGNKDWHVILYGKYPSKEKAKAVIPYLPGYIQHNNPWPKDLKSVQKAIKQLKKP